MLEHKNYIDINAFQTKYADGFNDGDEIQISEKIDGCFANTTQITLADGATRSIGDIVENKIKTEVMSYNEETHTIEPKKIINWYNNGHRQEFIRVKYESVQACHTNRVLYVTPNHLFFTKVGWKEAKDLTDNDELGFAVEKLNFAQEQFIYGGLLGDSGVIGIVRNMEQTEAKNRGVRWGHSNKQIDYQKFCDELMKPFIYKTEPYVTQFGSEATRSTSRFIKCFELIAREVLNPDTQKKQVNLNWLNKLSPLGLAFWYMDDGSLNKGSSKQRERVCLHTEGFSKEENYLISSFFKEKWNMDCTPIFNKEKYYRIDFSADGSESFFSLIAPYVITSLQYKLPQGFRMEKTFWDYWKNEKESNGLYWTKVIGVYPLGKNHPNKNNYDLEIEDNHNFFANGVLVHNCNASIQYNVETDMLDCFSRKKCLTPTNTLNGAYGYVQNLNKEPFRNYKDYRIFGEWLIKNKIIYPQEVMRKFYSFDVYDTVNQKWMPQDFCIKMAQDCGLLYVPIFYDGAFISWEHIASFVGKAGLGEDQGEGVVVINKTRLNSNNEKLPFVVKLVSAQFKEKMNHAPKEPINPDELAKKQYLRELAETIVTIPRIDKNLFKMIVEDNLIPEDWDAKDMSIIARNLPSIVYRDCVKEENDVVLQIDNFGKICNQITMERIKELLKERQSV